MSDSCSGLAAALGEPLAGTAGYARSWLLVEQPGPWGRFAFRESRLDPDLGAAIEKRCAEAGVNTLLVKRPGRPDGDTTRRAILASSRPGETWARTIELDEPQAVLDLDLDGLARGERPQIGDDLADPIFLVCTNGKRDACCAAAGRPIAAALHTAWPASTWECSHTGGHRFAGVMICLPDGLCYGRLDVETALRAAAAYRQRRVEPAFFRGRTALDGAAQAADAYLRAQEAISGIDDLTVVDGSNGSVVLELRDGPRFAVRLRQEEADPARPASCRDLGTEGKRPVVWTLDSIERL